MTRSSICEARISQHSNGEQFRARRTQSHLLKFQLRVRGDLAVEREFATDCVAELASWTRVWR